MPLATHIAERTGTWDKAEILEEHAHSTQCVYPTLGAGVTATGAAGAWTLGNFVEIVPVNTITLDFDIHWINIEAVSAADSYELVLYVETTEIGRTRFTVLGTPANTIIPVKNFQSKIVKANSQIQAKIANAGGGGETATISVEYHTY